MTPKIFHYVWLGGGEKKPLHQKCIDSWHEHLSGWSIIEWNESNFDVEGAKRRSKFFKLAYENRIYEFIADYARLEILYEHGGVYADTDIQLLKDLAPLLSENFFVGMQYPDPMHPWVIEGAVMGAPPRHSFVKEAIDYYNNEFWSSRAAINEIVAQPWC